MADQLYSDEKLLNQFGRTRLNWWEYDGEYQELEPIIWKQA